MNKKQEKKKEKQLDCCVALSTPTGRGAIAIVRLSGKGAKDIAKKMFVPFPSAPKNLQVGTLTAGDICDNAMCVFFDAPHSYTGEDMAEFHLHGGMRIASAVVESCVLAGCRLAQQGEFTKRAFLNGKKNLIQAEGLLDIIDAESKREVQNGFKLLQGQLDLKLNIITDELTSLIAEINAALDYPEEDLELPTKAKVQKQAQQMLEKIENLLSTAAVGKLIKNGIEVVIAGAVNAGKSSLLNALVGFDRAIVTEIAGTTRDTLSQSAEYEGVKLHFVDTAGIRETNDIVENLGVERARNAIAQADIILLVVDACGQAETKEFSALKEDKRTITVFNKIDKASNFVLPKNAVAVSALTGENLPKLQEKILQKTRTDKIDEKEILLTNTRQIDCLNRAADALKRTLSELPFATADCTALALSEAWTALGEATGRTVTEAVTDKIFEKFCVGK